MDSTICAISTSTGVGAISIIRCSGIDAIKYVNSIFKGKNLEKVDSHTINYGFIEYKNELIDEVLVSVMKAPKTFTMEDVVEINSHGGPATTNKILQILLEIGCRLAEPGEFTKRAFLNGRIDLLEAEAVGDLISSETEKSRKLAMNQLGGNLSNKVKEIRKEVIDLQANLEVNIDFPEYEEGNDYTNSTIIPRLDIIKKLLIELLKNSENGKIIKQGISVALVGKPNVGKSSILNNLLDEEKAIVTSIPGTTRDIVEGRITLDGVLLNLIDTAGIRETQDLVEKIGVEKSLNISKNADLVIFVFNNNEKITKEELDLLKSLKNQNIIVFINKNDLNTVLDVNELNGFNIVYGNTLNYDGLKNLKMEISKMFNLNKLDNSDYTFISNARCLSLIKQSYNVLEGIYKTINSYPIDMVSIDLKNIYELLGEVIGESYKDDLLDELFSKFCLGK